MRVINVVIMKCVEDPYTFQAQNKLTATGQEAYPVSVIWGTSTLATRTHVLANYWLQI